MNASTSAQRYRLLMCAATIAACLPYVSLKVAWVLGLEIGITGHGFDDTTRVANVVTAALELAVIAVAVALVVPRGRRIPAPFVVLPAWVATGLLVPVGLGAAVGIPLQMATGGGNPLVGDDVLAPWVFAVVYLGFAAQAVFLLNGFVLYARDRWPGVFAGGPPENSPTRLLQGLLGGVFAVAALVYAVQQLVWVRTGGGEFADPNTGQSVFLVTCAVASVLGALASFDLARGADLTRARLAAVWVGTAVAFSTTFPRLLKDLAIDPDAWGGIAPDPLGSTITLLVLLASLGGAIGGVLRLADESCRPTRELSWRGSPASPCHAG